jgi:GNAT superfamily N-acetyltransferase
VTTADFPYRITAHDPAAYTDDELAQSCEFGNVLQAEVLPDDPPTPLDDLIANHRATPARLRRYAFRAWNDEGSLVGRAVTNIDPEHDDNPDLLQVDVLVLPEHRRHGLGGRLLAELVTVAKKENRTRLHFNTNEPVPAGAAFAASLRAAPKMAMHVNHLPLADVDRAQLEQWVADAATRSADYELIGWDDRTPDEHLERWVDIVLVMNTAPRDDLDINDFTYTAEIAREHELQREATGAQAWTLVARHRDTGEWAGFHDVYHSPSAPTIVWVGATGVRPEHRGAALGKWLKAAMTLRVLDERPDVTEIRTGNADSNDAMLGINRAMGYKPFIASTAWELSVDDAEAWLRHRNLTP